MALAFFLSGLIIGSFLNVVVLRLETGLSLGGRSKCPSCYAIIRWYDNIPVLSFLLLGRHCRHCRFPIAWQYPMVEIATGSLFALFGTLSFGGGTSAEIALTVWHLFLGALLLAIALYDTRNMEIPLVLLLVGVIGVVIYAGIATYLAPYPWFDAAAPWREMLWGGGIAAAFFYALVYFSRETWMGMGDVWLAGMVGAAVGLPTLLLLCTLSFFFGAIAGIGLLMSGKRGLKSQIPFAPFLALGTLVTLFLQLLDPWWLSLLHFPPV